MRSQDYEVNGAREAFTGESSRAESKIIGAERMISDVRNEKKNRDSSRRNHAQAMPVNINCQNEIKAEQQKNAAQSIQCGIYVGKNLERVHGIRQRDHLQNPSNTKRIIHKPPIKCQYQPTTCAS